MKERIKNSIIINAIILYLGYTYFIFFKKTPRYSYMSLINLYCLTNGRFLNFFNKNFLDKSMIALYPKSNSFKNSSKEDYKKINKNLIQLGYHKLEEKLNSKRLDQILEISKSLKPETTLGDLYFDEKNIISKAYKYNSNQLINNKLIQELIMDPFLINVARNYLKCEPIFDFVSMWWSTDFKSKEDVAQEFHFDLDRPKWIKIFIYINDVTKLNGPHCYIEKSHLKDSKPKELLNRRYVRISDNDINNYYDKNQIKEITGQAGTIIFGDTLCWHKGKPIEKGSRLILQFEYTNSLFGINIPKFEVKKDFVDFKNFCSQNKRFSKNIKFK